VTPPAHVAEHALAVDGPLCEYYLISSRDTPDLTQWRTEIGWPIFHRGTDCSPDPAPMASDGADSYPVPMDGLRRSIPEVRPTRKADR
jgi:hypothetical protein